MMEVIEMNSSPGGPIAIMFMMVPLIVVPLIAIFGIPNLPTNLSSAATEDSAIQFDEIEADDEGLSSSDEDAPAFDDEPEPVSKNKRPFKKVTGNSANRRARLREEADWTPPEKAMAGWSVDSTEDEKISESTELASAPSFDDDAILSEFHQKYDDENIDSKSRDSGSSKKSRFTLSRRTKTESDDIEFEKDSTEEDWISDEALLNAEPLALNSQTDAVLSNESGDSGLKMGDAIKKLQSLGIKNFQMVPGSEPGEFMFRCVTVSPQNSRLVFRFESEAKDPLLAVKDVLRQVEKWNQQQK